MTDLNVSFSQLFDRWRFPLIKVLKTSDVLKASEQLKKQKCAYLKEVHVQKKVVVALVAFIYALKKLMQVSRFRHRTAQVLQHVGHLHQVIGVLDGEVDVALCRQGPTLHFLHKVQVQSPVSQIQVPVP